MAHKTNSKEQFKFNIWYYKVSFKNKIKLNTYDKTFLYQHSNSILDNNCIYKNFLFIYITKKNLTYFETNLFFLKSYLFLIKFSDSSYFNVNYFI